MLEAACLQKYNPIAVGSHDVGLPVEGAGALKVAMEFLTGVPAINVRPDNMTNQALEDLLDRLCRDKTSAAVSTKSSRELGRPNILVQNHCYSLIAFDRETDKVTLRNCWGNEPVGVRTLDVRAMGDGLVELPLAAFINTFARSAIHPLFISSDDRRESSTC